MKVSLKRCVLTGLLSYFHLTLKPINGAPENWVSHVFFFRLGFSFCKTRVSKISTSRLTHCFMTHLANFSLSFQMFLCSSTFCDTFAANIC